MDDFIKRYTKYIYLKMTDKYIHTMNKHAQALGRIKTKKKAKASRLNGKKGGRPKGKKKLSPVMI